MPISSRLDQLVIFSLSGEEYALPVGHVQEIIRLSELRSVASDEPWIRGGIDLRGRIVPVCDLAARLGAAATDPSGANIVIVETEQGTAGMIVDGVDEVLTIDPDQLRPVPSSGAEVMRAIVEIGDRLVLLLDPHRILAGATVAA